MQYRRLGRTDLQVSAICLGTMTWGGAQNNQDDGFAQMDLALDHGVNFWDTAEMYAVPPSAETYGKTETIIGNWFKSRGKRDKVVLATKVCGRTQSPWVRGGQHRLDRANIEAALDASLKRLQTDYVDLYQLHWPDRTTHRFGAFGHNEPPAPGDVPILETLEALAGLVKAGKVRHIGLSNETAWGTMEFVRLSEQHGLPRIVSIQNAYNLLNRTFDLDLAEVCLNTDVGLLAYSPIAGGHLTGKYLGGQIPPGTRRALDPRPSRYNKPRAEAAIQAYVDIARRHGLEPNQVAVAWTLTRPFVASSIIGATSIPQLESNLRAIDLVLSPDVMGEIEDVHRANANPCP
ncbi:MAG TPA: aldo/keto reductase [Azospirillaceae bacterium]|nr:aldo/keto reductase [Azospirillaceae bacterium]